MERMYKEADALQITRKTNGNDEINMRGLRG